MTWAIDYGNSTSLYNDAEDVVYTVLYDGCVEDILRRIMARNLTPDLILDLVGECGKKSIMTAFREYVGAVAEAVINGDIDDLPIPVEGQDYIVDGRVLARWWTEEDE